MIVLELFAGFRSIGSVFEERGHKVYSVEWDRSFENISLYADVGTLTADQVIEYVVQSKLAHITSGIPPHNSIT